VRSARWTLVCIAALALLAAGCDTTQQKSARAKLEAQRELASRVRVLVTQPGPDVRVDSATLVGRAIVVQLRNTSTRIVGDLPISVGVRTHGGRVYLNHRKGLAYFQSHTPAIAPGASATWVFASKKRIGGVPFAAVGAVPTPPIAPGSRLPVLSVSALRGTRSAVTATVRNGSGVPQYGLDVYAVAQRSGRYVAAGRTVIPTLGSGHSTTVSVPLDGSARGASIELHVSPTIFH
jgi:hypothetical protein